MSYASRKDQMKAFAKAYQRKSSKAMLALLRDACMCGAVEERSRTLTILKKPDQTIRDAMKEITEKSVLYVIGYEPGRKS